MIRKQKSKILVFLLMLGLLYGCKRQILDPLNPQNNLPQKANFDKVKGFYENGRYKNQPKRTSGNGNERMSAQDSARFKDFEPQWDKTEVELLPNNEKMLIVPVVRFLSVKYKEDIGFIRRLCIRVDANDVFLEANIVELVGNLNFVKTNYNDIFKNYKENSVVSGFKGTVIIYELDYNIKTVKFYNGGVFKENTIIVQAVDSSTQRASTCFLLISTYIPGSCPNQNDPYHGTAVNCPNDGYWEAIGVFSQCETFGGIGGNSGSGSPVPSGGTSGGGGGGGGTGTTTSNPMCKSCEDGGVSWEEEEEESTSLPRIIQDPTLNNRYNAKIKCVYNKVMAMPEMQDLLARFADANGFTLTVKVENMGSGGSQRGKTEVDSTGTAPNRRATNNVIVTINSEMMNGYPPMASLDVGKTLIHEIMHAVIFTMILHKGGMKPDQSGMLVSGALPTIEPFMALYKEINSTAVDMNRVQHEYIASLDIRQPTNLVMLTDLIKAYDGARATDAEYRALAWDGLEVTTRNDDAGFLDQSMRDNRDTRRTNLRNARIAENPCQN